jgi:ATPase subunit of ABC transporter with duplicated ATPase domains
VHFFIRRIFAGLHCIRGAVCCCQAIDEIVEAEVLQVLRDARQTMLLKAVGHKAAAMSATTDNAAAAAATTASAVLGEIDEEEARRMEVIAAQATAAAAASKISQNMDVPLDKQLFSGMVMYFEEKLLQLCAPVDGSARDGGVADLAALSIDGTPSSFSTGESCGFRAKTPLVQAAMASVRHYVAETCALFLLTTTAAFPPVEAKSTDVAIQRSAIAEIVARSGIFDWNRCVAPFIRDAMGYVLEDGNYGGPSAAAAAAVTASAVTAALTTAGDAARKASDVVGDDALPMTTVTNNSNANNKYSRSRGNSTIRSRANSTLSVTDGLPSVSYLCALYRAAVLAGVPDCDQEPNDEDADLCNIEFSLAYGGKILLHNTHLRLGRGRRYGLMGKNGAGKTTLLVNIGNGHIEGLPSTLRTVYVQHDDASDDRGVSVLNELMDSKEMQALTSLDESNEFFITRKDAATALRAVGFTKEMLSAPRSALSGGWKMKLLIVKAMLSKPNVLLLDEPTNHLDTSAVAWLVNYLQSTPDLTCLIVSHDTKFLDDVVTDIIHYEQLKLVYYRGNMTAFVEIKPEAKYYFDLSGETLSFRFPLPERLDGVNSLSRAVLKVDNVTYTYPGASVPTLRRASAKVSLGSRVAVTGANGAGKSTLIKLLVQEVEQDPPTEANGIGEVYKHHNLRVAYVAQHSFHHLEQALDLSPVDYIKQRFYGGVDKEDLSRQNMKLSEDEVDKVAEKKYGEVDAILGRRKNGHTMEYECTFIGQTARDPNKYIARERLIEFGLIKLVNQCDAKVAAAAAGLAVRPLLTVEIQGHLDDFNLESEFGTHGSIRRLSGGQKVSESVRRNVCCCYNRRPLFYVHLAVVVSRFR